MGWVNSLLIPYSSKFSRHKNFVKHTIFAKLLIFAAMFRKAWRGLIVAVVACITTSLWLFLGCVLLICSSFGCFCGRLGRWVAVLSSSSATDAFVGRLAISIQKDGIRNERGPVGLGNTAFEGLDFLKPAVFFIKTWQCITRSAREKATPLKLNFRE